MKFGTLTCVTAALIASGVLTTPVRLAAQNPSSGITTFDAPGAAGVPGSGFGTFPRSINASGAITGSYVDAKNVRHGFLRSPLGDKLITFDAPGAGTVSGSGFGTFPESINAGGAITGSYVDANNVRHGFLRSPLGDKFITFDAPGAAMVSGSGFGTFPESINDAGAITGHYTDANRVHHGFLRDPRGGEFVALRPAGADGTPGSGDGTFPRSINPAGAVAGNYKDADAVSHGFFASP